MTAGRRPVPAELLKGAEQIVLPSEETVKRQVTGDEGGAK